jgi:beta-lactamase superfamily II metal-dependent hydrolase
MTRVSVDLLDIRDKQGRILTTLAWGDEITVVERTGTQLQVELTRFVEQDDGSIIPQRSGGFVKPSKSSKLSVDEVVSDRDAEDVLRLDFVDVQQGDGSVIETPGGRVVLVDGGDNQLFARYLANRFRGTTAENPKEIECIVVTHGDADHFVGLTEIHRSEANATVRKRFFIHPKRVYHNGLVKRPDRVRELDRLGPTVTVGRETFVTGLVDDLLAVPDGEMNDPFLEWKRALAAFSRRGRVQFRRLRKGHGDPFRFLRDEGIRVQVLGPIEKNVGGNPALEFLRVPPPRVGDESDASRGARGKKSASHTINGHSIVLRLAYGKWTFLYAGDLNEPAEASLLAEHDRGAIDLRAEVLKVPHHGSADFAPKFLAAVSPLVSVVSSGDERITKEYIHPRASLMSALGRCGRGEDPVVFVTELVAFFKAEDWVELRGRRFYAFSRAAFGLVKVRTDGERLLVYTNSAQTKLKEAYAYEFENGEPKRADIRRA